MDGKQETKEIVRGATKEIDMSIAGADHSWGPASSHSVKGHKDSSVGFSS